MTSSVRKKVTKCLCRISSFYRSSPRKCSAKKVFLKIWQCSQENTCCVGVSLSAFRFAILLISDTNAYTFLQILRSLKEQHFEEDLRMTASSFQNENRNKFMGFQFCQLTWLQRKIQRNCIQI